MIISMLQRSEGATIAELMSATGWLSHTVRAALTGLRKRGHDAVRSRGEDQITRYCIGRTPDGAATQTVACPPVAEAA